MRNVSRTIGALSALALLFGSGCEMSSTSSESPFSTAGCDSPFHTASLFNPSEIQGSWSSPCVQVSPGSGFNLHSMKEVLSFVGTTMTTSDLFYSDSYCQTPYFAQQVVSPFTLGGNLSTNTTSRTLDMTINAVLIKPDSAQGALDLNATSACGLTSYAQGVDTDITGRTCSGQPTVSAGTVLYQIVQVDTACNRLKVGYSTGTSPASRPTSLNGSESAIYRKGQ